MFAHSMRVWFLVALLSLAGCGGGGGSSSVQVGNLTYTAHDFSLSPSTIKGASASTQLELYVKEQAGSQIKPYSSAVVSFESTCILEGRARVSATRVINGVYSATYTNMGCSGEDVIQANISVSGGAVVAPLEKSLTITDVIVQTGNLTLTAANTSVPADGFTQTAIRALVVSNFEDVNGDPKPIIGASVKFSTNLGRLSSTQAITDIDGYATVFLIADNTPGLAVVSAEQGGYVRTVSVGFGSVMPADKLVVSVTPERVRPGEPTTITTKVVDSTGRLVPDVNLVYSIENNLSGGYLTTFNSATNAKGESSITYVAGTKVTDTQDPQTGIWVAGYDEILVSTSNGVSQLAKVRVNADTAGFNTLVFSIGGEEVPANNETKVLLQASVIDGNLQPVIGEEVGFTTNLGVLVDLEGNETSTAITGADGVARIYLKAGPVTEETEVKVSASYKGVISTQVITFYPNP